MSQYHFKNLIFEGGGVKGIAYVGAINVLEEKGIVSSIERVGGTSAGAINALLFALGYTNDEVKDILWTLDFNSFMDDSWGYVRDSARLIDKFGWYKGDFFRSWVGELIARKTGNPEATFNDLNRLKDKKGCRDIYMVGTNLSTHFSETFSYEHTPRMPVADAVRISMSIPLFFAAQRNFRNDVYVDGGVLDNYPIKLFDRKKYIEPESVETYSIEPDYYGEMNKRLVEEGREISPYVYNMETLGFRLDSKEEISMFRDQAEPVSHRIDNFFDYSWALIETILEAQGNQHLHTDDWHRTIYIDTLGVKTTQFDLDEKTKQDLVDSGNKYTVDYFKWYDDPANRAKNRP